MTAPAAIVFDLDGTLIDSRGDICAAANYALSRSGRSPLPAAALVRFVGDGARTLLSRAANLSEASGELDAMVDDFIAYYVNHPIDFTRWVEGAPEALEALQARNLPLAICTNKARPVTEAVLAALGATDTFKSVYAGGDGPKKPSPDALRRIADALKVPPQLLVMVGDGPQDIYAARAIGCRVVGIASGYLPRERVSDAAPDVLLDDLKPLPGVVRRWCDTTVRIPRLR
jgi:2-phosphoglycolate phosphatase